MLDSDYIREEKCDLKTLGESLETEQRVSDDEQFIWR